MTLPIQFRIPSVRSGSSALIFARLLFFNAVTRKLATLLLVVAGFSGAGQSAIAQVTINRDANTGVVEVDQNAFDIRTGELTNTSNIPLPTELPERTVEGQAIPTFNEDSNRQLAPNSLDITTDFEFIRQSFNNALDDPEEGLSYDLQRRSVRTRTAFDLRYVPGNHAFGEGIQVRVFDEEGNVIREERRFVRGDEVTRGPQGQELGSDERIEVEYGVDERVELRILNLRDDGAQPTESGVYFTRDGQIIAEDIQDGGDRDFDDGEYVELEGADGTATAVETRTREAQETETDETPLDPEIRRDEITEETEFTTVERDEDVVEEVIERGSIDTPDTLATKLGHAVGLYSENDELLVYDRYSSTAQLRAGSDGLGVTGQLRPLFGPSAPPTLLNGSANFNPFVDDNEAGFAASVGVTQFLSRTHRRAADALGNPIENPNPDGATPLEPTGLFNNRRMVGYVPADPGEAILPSNGIFSLPDDKKVMIDPPNPQAVGAGDAAYTDNVGGYIVESASGELTFIPQWTKEGYAQDALTLESGEATRVIYALVPQQSGQNLRLGQAYAVDSSGGDYRIADGGFTVIAADQYPENFFEETTDVYTVEDTLQTIANAATSNFNGVRGLYVERPGGELTPTVDPNIPAEADARVGNFLSPEPTPGQRPYARTTRAAGLYLSGSLTGGIGNQKDRTTQIRSTVETATDQMRVTRTTNTFRTPVTQVDARTFETITTTQRDGNASFQVDGNGLLQEVKFDPTSDEREVSTTRNPIGEQSDVVLGEEVLDDTSVDESVMVLGTRSNVIARDESSGSDSYANASPVSGEIALGGVLNFGNTPWSPAANVVRAELFARDTVIGRGGDGSETGWRAELMLHPFGEQKRDAYQYDENGDVVAVYKTEPELDAQGNQMMDTLTGEDGETVEMPRNQFLLDENGAPVQERVGTGRSKGPGVYVRVEDAWDDGDSAAIDGGVQFSF